MYRSSKFKCSVNVQMTWGAKNWFDIKENRNSKKFSLEGMPSFNLKSYIYSLKKTCLLQNQLAHLKPFKGMYLFFKNKYIVAWPQIGD